MNEFSLVDYENDSEIAIVRLNRPESLNALNQDLISALDRVLDEIQANSAIRGVVLSSTSSRAFSSGADVKEIRQLTRNEFLLANRRGAELFQRIEEYPVPVAAAIRGYALGGGFELALASDFRFADSSAVVGLPELRAGFIPGWGGVKRLCSIVGAAKARDLVLSGVSVTATQATDLGLFSEPLVSDPERAAVLKLRSLPDTPVGSVAYVKHLFARVLNESEFANLSTLFVADLLAREEGGK